MDTSAAAKALNFYWYAIYGYGLYNPSRCDIDPEHTGPFFVMEDAATGEYLARLCRKCKDTIMDRNVSAEEQTE